MRIPPPMTALPEALHHLQKNQNQTESNILVERNHREGIRHVETWTSKPNTDNQGEKYEKQEARIDLVFSEAPDSSPRRETPDGGGTPDISISSVRRLSVEQGTTVEKVVLSHLRRSSVELDDTISQRSLSAESNSFQSPRQRRLSGDDGVNVERRRSSLSVPLDAGSLQLADRWVTKEDLSPPRTETKEGGNTSAPTRDFTDNVFHPNPQDNKLDAVTSQTKATDQTPSQTAEHDTGVIDTENSPGKPLQGVKDLTENAKLVKSCQDDSEGKCDNISEAAPGSSTETGERKETTGTGDVYAEAVPNTAGDAGKKYVCKDVIENHLTERQILDQPADETVQSDTTTPSPKSSPRDTNSEITRAEITTPSPDLSSDVKQKATKQDNEVNASSSSLASSSSASDNDTLTNTTSSKSSNPETKVTTKSDQSEELGRRTPSDLSSPLPATPEEMARKQEVMRAGQSTSLPQGLLLQDEELEALKQEVERDVSRPQDPSYPSITVALPSADPSDLYVIHEAENETSEADQSGAYRKEDFGLDPANTSLQQSVIPNTAEEQTSVSPTPVNTEHITEPEFSPPAAETEPEPEEASHTTKLAADDSEKTHTPAGTPTILITNPDTEDSRSSEEKSER
ncbi:hypothetical protein ACOMHN_017207 [Nucella lapillus]